jgi:HAD superfamily hydrolase (TIGR01509 family)
MLSAGLSQSEADRFDLALEELDCFRAYQRGALPLDAYCSALGQSLGGISLDEAERTHNAILQEAYPGIPELLQEIADAGLKTGCLSNTNEPHWKAMFENPKLAVLSTLDYPVASHLVGEEKPQLAMYRAFERASGAQGGQIAFFDDAPANVRAAQILDWNAFWVEPDADPPDQMRKALAGLGWLPTS